MSLCTGILFGRIEWLPKSVIRKKNTASFLTVPILPAYSLAGPADFSVFFAKAGPELE